MAREAGRQAETPTERASGAEGPAFAQLHALITARLETIIDAAASMPANLRSAIRHALVAPSKRVRPILVCLIAEPGATPSRSVLDAGCAIELIHTASLILDDLPCMDDAQLRRQRPTTHMVFGQATAILAAIAMLTEAFGIVARLDGVEADVRTRIASLLSEAVGWNGLVAGQELDVNARGGYKTGEEIERLNWLKTGVLFVAAAETGALLAGLPAGRTAAVRRFAHHLGLAFQTADDLLDGSASATEAGKDVNKDGEKPTLVSLLGAEDARMSFEEHLALADRALVESAVAPERLRALTGELFAARRQKR